MNIETSPLSNPSPTDEILSKVDDYLGGYQFFSPHHQSRPTREEIFSNEPAEMVLWFNTNNGIKDEYDDTHTFWGNINNTKLTTTDLDPHVDTQKDQFIIDDYENDLKYTVTNLDNDKYIEQIIVSGIDDTDNSIVWVNNDDSTVFELVTLISQDVVVGSIIDVDEDGTWDSLRVGGETYDLVNGDFEDLVDMTPKEILREFQEIQTRQS